MRNRSAIRCAIVFLLPAAVLSIGTPCRADVVSVNTTTCVSGAGAVPCNTPTTLTDGQIASSAFDLIFTLPDNDEFQVAGNTFWHNTGGGGFSFNTSFVAEYLGNAVNGNVPSQADNITFNDQQFMNLDGSTAGSFNESASPLFIGSLGAGTHATAFYTVDGQALPTMNFTQGSGPESNNNVSLTGLTEPMLFDWVQTESFGAGSLRGSEITDQVPEPGSFALLLGTVIALALNRAFRNHQNPTTIG